MSANDSSCELGQVSVLFVLVLVMALVLIVGIAGAGRVAVERARARTAADAVVLAGGDPIGEQALIERWGQLGAEVHVSNGSAIAVSGHAQAQAWALPAEAQVTRAPLLVAIVARADQLLGGTPLAPVAWYPTSIVLRGDDATRFATVASEFTMCLTSNLDTTTFTLCP